MNTNLIHGDPEAQYRGIVAKVAQSADPDAAIDVACFMSTDSVDADNEVMLPDGVDLSRFEKNPVLLLCHAYGQPGSYYPLPVGKVEWTKKRPRGILAGVRFTLKTPMGREVKALFEDDMLRSFSVGFRPIESSPMTSEEAHSRPDWRAAFERTRGRILVHRKWHLLELSVAPVPSNPDALVTRYKSKGVSPPAWLSLTPEVSPMGENVTKCASPLSEGMHVRHLKSGACGEVKSIDEDGMAEVDAHDEECAPTGEMKPWHSKDVAPIEADEETEMKAAKPTTPYEGEETPAEEAAEEQEDGDEAEAGKIKRGVHVHIKAPHYKGVGVVQGVYRRGHVPNVEDDMRGTPDDPAARVKCYKSVRDGHEPTGDHIAAKVAHLTPMDEEMKAPSKGKTAPPVKAHASLLALPPLISLDDLPPLVALPEPEPVDLAVLVKQAMAVELDRRMGVV